MILRQGSDVANPHQLLPKVLRAVNTVKNDFVGQTQGEDYMPFGMRRDYLTGEVLRLSCADSPHPRSSHCFLFRDTL